MSDWRYVVRQPVRGARCKCGRALGVDEIRAVGKQGRLELNRRESGRLEGAGRASAAYPS